MTSPTPLFLMRIGPRYYLKVSNIQTIFKWSWYLGAARVRHEGEHVDAGMDGGREEHEQT